MDLQSIFSFDFNTVEWKALLSYGSIFTSIVLFTVVGIGRGVLIRHIRKDAEVLDKEQRRWTIRVKNAAAIVIVFGLLLIWAPELHTFALSVAAFAAALVIATKEMILCLGGAVMRATSQTFTVGEWITVDNLTGEVIDLDAFSFRLQEVDMEGKTYQFTGRVVSVPNSVLFTAKIANANFFKAYIFEDVRMAVQYMDIDPAAALAELKAIVEKHFEPYRKDSFSFNRKIRKRAAIDIGTAEPIYDLTTTDFGHYHFHARVFVPTEKASLIGSEISTEFLSRVHKMRMENVEILRDAVARKEAEMDLEFKAAESAKSA